MVEATVKAILQDIQNLQELSVNHVCVLLKSTTPDAFDESANFRSRSDALVGIHEPGAWQSAAHYNQPIWRIRSRMSAL